MKPSNTVYSHGLHASHHLELHLSPRPDQTPLKWQRARDSILTTDSLQKHVSSFIIINALRKLPAAFQFEFNLDVGLRVISPANSDVTLIVCLLGFNLGSEDGLRRDYVEEN